MSAIITVENLSKSYLLKHKQGDRYVVFRDVLANAFKNPFGKRNNTFASSEEFWALKDLNFEVKQGDRVGIIGRNGAGKSTLLKVLSRIVSPTTGRITIDGRVASLLEVGTGFHPELSGRENIYLNGSILGMSRAEIKSKFDEIVAFAEIEKFLDTPVKRYSSGMYVRLAFAVAAHLDPEILIVDEVLAVGDSAFQKKCLGKMEEVSNGGRTILFVSHQMDTVTRLCNRAILLKDGQLVTSGSTDQVISTYMRSGFGTTAQRSWAEDREQPGNEICRLLEVRVHDSNFDVMENFDVTKPVGISMDYEVLQDGDVFTHSYNFFNDQGVNIFNTHDTVSELRREPRKKGIYTATMWVEPNLLNEGAVVVGVAVIKIEPFKIYFHERDAVSFNVIDHLRGDSARGDYTLGFGGAVRPLCQWETKRK
jgi:lipopolysaccharide transport system ATP-binding protein